MDEIELTSPTHFTDHPLDTRVNHVFHLKIKAWQISVLVHTASKSLNETFSPSDTFSKVEKFVRDKMGNKKLFLFDGKEKLNSSLIIGSRFKGEFAELKAYDPSDAAQRAKFAT